MGTIHVIFGRSRWRRVQAVRAVQEALQPGARRVIVVGHEKQREDWWRDVAQTPEAASTVVHTVPELFESLWARAGDGRPFLSDLAQQLAARRWLADHAERFPLLSRIRQGPELAWHLASLERGLAEQRILQLSEPDLDDIVAMLRRSHPDAYVRPSYAKQKLIRKLEHPSVGLNRWLESHPSIVFDDLLQPSPLTIAVLLALARALVSAGGEVIFTLASGRDRGGAEAGVLLGWDTDDPSLKDETRIVGAQTELRQALFTLVESGEAAVHCVGENGIVTVEPWTVPEPAARRDLADAYADGQPIEAKTDADVAAWLGDGRMQLWRAADPAHEAQLAARTVKLAIRSGLAPEDAVIAVADLPRQRAVLVEALTVHGVPHALPTPLVERPVAQAVLLWLEVGSSPPDPDTLCDLAEAMGVKLPADARHVRRWLLRAGIGEGDVESWAIALARWMDRNRLRVLDEDGATRTIEVLSTLYQRATALAAAETPHAWLDAMLGLMRPLATTHDPLRLQAWGAVERALQRFATAAATVHAGRWSPDEIYEHVRAVLSETSWVPNAPVAQVRIMDAREVMGLTPEFLWVMGLSRGAFPERPPVAFLVQPMWRRRLAADPVVRARHALASWMRDALEPMTNRPPWPRLGLSWPATREGRAVPPSALVADLLDLPAGEGPFEDAAVLGPVDAPKEPASLLEGLGRAAMAAQRGENTGWRERLPKDWQVDLDVALSVKASRQGPWGPFDGMLGDAPQVPATLSVTAVEGYIKCPQRYFYDRVLKLSPPDAWAPELEPRRKGTALHGILEQFLRRRRLAPLTGEDPESASRELFDVACEVLDEVERQGGFDPLYQSYARAQWLAGLVDDAPAGILRAWLDQEIAATDGRVPVAVEAEFDDLKVGPVRLRGVLDRLDRLPDGSLVVTDYKTGQPPSRRAVAEGRSLQPYAYAAAATKDEPEAKVASTFLSLAKPDRLRRSGWMGDPGTLDAVCSPSERRYAIMMNEWGRDQILAQAGEQVRGLLAGQFMTTKLGPDAAGCRTCPHARICRVDHTRQADLVRIEDEAKARGDR